MNCPHTSRPVSLILCNSGWNLRPNRIGETLMQNIFNEVPSNLTIEPTIGWFMPWYMPDNGKSLRTTGLRAVPIGGHVSGIYHPMAGSIVVRWCQIDDLGEKFTADSQWQQWWHGQEGSIPCSRLPVLNRDLLSGTTFHADSRGDYKQDWLHGFYGNLTNWLVILTYWLTDSIQSMAANT